MLDVGDKVVAYCKRCRKEVVYVLFTRVFMRANTPVAIGCCCECEEMEELHFEEEDDYDT